MQELQSISANFPLNVKLMAHCTRNKIAQAGQAALRVLPARTPSRLAGFAEFEELPRVQEP
jgi:hypothetical protein